MRRLTTIEFIQKSTMMNNCRYSYSNVIYKNARTNVVITCIKHGNFSQNPSVHLHQKSGCPKCKSYANGVLKKSNTHDFTEKSIIVHGATYDYSLVEYENNQKKVKIICSSHGEFSQTPANHLFGSGCKQCADCKSSKALVLGLKSFSDKAKMTHGDKYNYSSVNYINTATKVKIICSSHGEFSQTPNSHFQGNGCPRCSGKAKYNKKKFLLRAMEVHGNRYKYTAIGKNITNRTKINIDCLKHGIFEQSIDAHINKKQGCPVCNTSKGELLIQEYLTLRKIKFFPQKTFNDCINPKTGKKLYFDFYVDELNTCIEYDGEQHEKSIAHWGGERGFTKRKELDSIKNDYCVKNDISLIRIRFDEKINLKLNNLL